MSALKILHQLDRVEFALKQIKFLSERASERPYKRRGRMSIESAQKKLVLSVDRVGNYIAGSDWPDIDFMIHATNTIEKMTAALSITMEELKSQETPESAIALKMVEQIFWVKP